MSALRFLNDVVKPWDELNVLLSERLALQPELSDVTRLAGALAVAIRHQVDVAGLKDQVVNVESSGHRVISDTADFWKHGSLRNAARNSHFSTESFFEYIPDKGFSFLKNVLFVEHASLGKRDFLEISLEAIRYWINKRGLNVTWQGVVRENHPEFHPEAFLRFESGKCISMDQVRLRFFSRGAAGALVPVDPPEVRFAVY